MVKKYNLLTSIAIYLTIATVQPLMGQTADIPDNEITAAVNNHLLVDETVSFHMVQVTTNEGIVILSGTVSHLLARDRAARIAESIKGVRSVVNNLEISPVQRSDMEIRTDVLTALAVDPATELYDVTAAAHNGVVELNGTVQSWAEKRLCENVAKSVKGIQKIQNNITVNFKGERPESEIKAEIQRRLRLDPYIPHQLLDIRVEGGIVTLEGAVGSAVEKTYTRNNCLVAGVEGVDVSDVKVTPRALEEMEKRSKYVLKSDEKIREAVNDALLWDPRTISFDIDVTVSNSIVTLAGEVDNLQAKRAAAHDARNTIGVIRVNNLIKVSPPKVTDREIESNVQSALLWDPVVERHEIDAVVRNKKVFLYGAVDSYFEKNRAEDVASRIKGVAEVDNFLTVNIVSAPPTDQEIKSNIENQLRWNPYIEKNEIDVEVQNGVATLKGKVDTYFERDEAIREAFEGGADSVKSKLKVKDSRDNNDEEEYRKEDEYFPLYYYYMN
ncbi:MAG: BON domain-containing protein [Chitinivibrionales bacterium]|nr:BON domain-containing protein [Chitinivibrionales bacterium]